MQCVTFIVVLLNCDHNLLNESVYLTYEMRQNETLMAPVGKLGRCRAQMVQSIQQRLKNTVVLRG